MSWNEEKNIQKGTAENELEKTILTISSLGEQIKTSGGEEKKNARKFLTEIYFSPKTGSTVKDLIRSYITIKPKTNKKQPGSVH
jgi:hypothetical protein